MRIFITDCGLQEGVIMVGLTRLVPKDFTEEKIQAEGEKVPRGPVRMRDGYRGRRGKEERLSLDEGHSLQGKTVAWDRWKGGGIGRNRYNCLMRGVHQRRILKLMEGIPAPRPFPLTSLCPLYRCGDCHRPLLREWLTAINYNLPSLLRSFLQFFLALHYLSMLPGSIRVNR